MLLIPLALIYQDCHTSNLLLRKQDYLSYVLISPQNCLVGVHILILLKLLNIHLTGIVNFMPIQPI